MVTRSPVVNSSNTLMLVLLSAIAELGQLIGRNFGLALVCMSAKGTLGLCYADLLAPDLSDAQVFSSGCLEKSPMCLQDMQRSG